MGETFQEKVFPFPEPLNDEQHQMLSMLVEPVEKYFEEKGKSRAINFAMMSFETPCVCEVDEAQ